MIGDRYWSIGITIKPCDRNDYSLSLGFLDNGFAEDGSTEGTLSVRYVVPRNKLAENAAVLKADAERLGIEFLIQDMSPSVYVEGDGWSDDPARDRPDLRLLANEIAEHLGWEPVYQTLVRDGA